MAKVYRTPIEAPNLGDFFSGGSYDREADDRAHKAYFAELAEWCKARHTGDLVGEVVYFPYADSAAAYMVMSHKPFALIHLPIHDAWSLPEAHTRGLRLSDVRAEVERSRPTTALFAERKAAEA